MAQFFLFGMFLLALTENRTASGPATAAGWALVVIAVLLGGSAFYMLRDKLTAMPAPVDGAVLHDRGPFGLVRHPIYGALILGFAGLAIKGANPLAFAVALLLVPFFYGKTTHEERLLAERFPEYNQYRQRVRRRVLPWIL